MLQPHALSDPPPLLRPTALPDLPSAFNIRPTAGMCCVACTAALAAAECANCTDVREPVSPFGEPFNLPFDRNCEAVEQRRNLVSRWVFGISTGHTATETFSNPDCYAHVDGPPSALVWEFEASDRYGDERHPSTHGLKVWYAQLAKLSREARWAEEKRFVNQVLIPDTIIDASRMPSGAVLMSVRQNFTLVDLGHHVNLGLAGALASTLQPKARFVRIIRSRYDTVRSFLAESKAPCEDGRYSLCPTTHPDIVLPPPGARAWAGLSMAQRNLWFIDEVEARWQHLLLRHPRLPHLTVRWCDAAQLQDAWERLATYIGDGALRPQACAHHEHGSANVSDRELEAADRQYVEAMKYTSAQRRLIRDVQRPFDCAA